MKAGQARIIFVTCKSLSEARRIATAVVHKRLAACVNILLNPAESVYRWKNKVETTREYLLIIKTTANRLSELEREVQSLHGYGVPEFIVLPVVAGSRAYLDWLYGCVPRKARKEKK